MPKQKKRGPCYLLSTKRGNIKEMTEKIRLINNEVITAINASTERNANCQYQDPFTGKYYTCARQYSFKWVNGKAERGETLKHCGKITLMSTLTEANESNVQDQTPLRYILLVDTSGIESMQNFSKWCSTRLQKNH